MKAKSRKRCNSFTEDDGSHRPDVAPSLNEQEITCFLCPFSSSLSEEEEKDGWPTWFAAAHRVTCTECIEGHLARMGSYMFTEYYDKATSGGVQMMELVHAYWALVISDDGPALFLRQLEPVLKLRSTFSQLMGITNFSHKLDSLCQAFTNQTDFQQAYDQLLAVAQDPSSHEGIHLELVQIGIQHFNFMDIVFEVVVLGVLGEARPQICPVSLSNFCSNIMWQEVFLTTYRS
ncbi:hypothetical protein MHYP_G00317450 [Metynnis hypsauchen]